MVHSVGRHSRPLAVGDEAPPVVEREEAPQARDAEQPHAEAAGNAARAGSNLYSTARQLITPQTVIKGGLITLIGVATGSLALPAVLLGVEAYKYASDSDFMYRFGKSFSDVLPHIIQSCKKPSGRMIMTPVLALAAGAATIASGGSLLAGTCAAGAIGLYVASPNCIETLGVSEDDGIRKLIEAVDHLNLSGVQKYSKFLSNLPIGTRSIIVQTIINSNLSAEIKTRYLDVLLKEPIDFDMLLDVLRFGLIENRVGILSKIDSRHYTPEQQTQIIRTIINSSDEANRDSFLSIIASKTGPFGKDEIIEHAIRENRIGILRKLIEGRMIGSREHRYYIDKAIRYNSSEEIFKLIGTSFSNTNDATSLKFIKHACKWGYPLLHSPLASISVNNPNSLMPLDQLSGNLEYIIDSSTSKEKKRSMIEELIKFDFRNDEDPNRIGVLLEICLDYAFETEDDKLLQSLVKNNKSALILSNIQEADRREAIRIACQNNNRNLFNVLMNGYQMSTGFKAELLQICLDSDSGLHSYIKTLPAVQKVDKFDSHVSRSLARRWRHFKRKLKNP